MNAPACVVADSRTAGVKPGGRLLHRAPAAPALAQSSTRPVRVVLIVDATDAIRQPIGLIRKALTVFVESIDARHEMMLVSVAGTPQIRVRPTLDRPAGA